MWVQEEYWLFLRSDLRKFTPQTVLSCLYLRVLKGMAISAVQQVS